MTQAPTATPARVIDATTCPVRDVLGRVASKWSILIIVTMAEAPGPIRFTELERRIDGISRRMLTLTLRNLERDGLIERTAYLTIPPKVEYALTGIAHELHGILAMMTDWAQRHQGRIATARQAFDQTHAGEPDDPISP
jgi:DNA-binding HxlR family transcriptional regulator